MFDAEIAWVVDWMMQPISGNPDISQGHILAFFAFIFAIAYLADRHK